MYRRSKFLELLLEIREDMAREAEYDVDQFVQNLGCGTASDDAPQIAPAAPLNGSEIKKIANVAVVSRKR